MSWCTLAVVVIVAIATVCKCDAVDIVRDGVPCSTIVLQKGAAQATHGAATELQVYLRKMSGAFVPIAIDPVDPIPEGTTEIRVGWGSGITWTDDPLHTQEQLVISVSASPPVVVLDGNNLSIYRGTAFAVYRFLDSIGVRWYMPGEFGEAVPKCKSISVPVGVTTEKPSFTMRHFAYPTVQPAPQMDWEWDLWCRHNLMGAMPVDHCTDRSWWGKLVTLRAAGFDVPQKDNYFETGADGVPDTSFPNLTNPESVSWTAGWLQQFAHLKGQTSASICPDDWRTYNAKRVGSGNLGFGLRWSHDQPSISEEWFRYVSAVADEINNGKTGDPFLVGTSAYYDRERPPEVDRLSPFMYVMYAPIQHCPYHSWAPGGMGGHCPSAKQSGVWIKRWLELCPGRVFLFRYMDSPLGSALTPVPRMYSVTRDTPWLHSIGLYGFNDETRPSVLEEGVVCRWLRPQLMWDANADAEVLIDRAFSEWYGPAAKDMRDYYYDLEHSVGDHMHEQNDWPLLPLYQRIMDHLRDLMLQAMDSAMHTPYYEHVNAEGLSLAHTWAYCRMQEARRRCDFDEALTELRYMKRLRTELSQISYWYCTPEAIEGDPYVGGKLRDREKRLLELREAKQTVVCFFTPKTASRYADGGPIFASPFEMVPVSTGNVDDPLLPPQATRGCRPRAL